MRFHVTGSIVYKLHIKRYLANGALAELRQTQREIWIWEQVPRVRWLELVHHEMSHAYDLEIGEPADDEARAKRVSIIAVGIAKDIKEQGGIESLTDMRPEGDLQFVPDEADSLSDELPTLRYEGDGTMTVAAPRRRAAGCRVETDVHEVSAEMPARGGRAWCTCGAVINQNVIITSPIEYHPGFGGQVVYRETVCPACGWHFRWTEGVDLYGVPNGGVADGPHIGKDPAVLRDFFDRLQKKQATTNT